MAVKRFAAWGCLLAGLGLAEPSSADESVVRAALSWSADPSCSDAESVERAVDARLGRPTFEAVNPEVVVRGEVQQEPSGTWLVRIELVDAEGSVLGQRVVESPARHCKALDDSIALVVALMVDIPKAELEQRKLERRQRRAELERQNQPAPPPASPPPRRITLPRTPELRTTWSFDARLEAVIAIGLMPDPAPGLALGLLIDPEHFWAIDLEAMVFAPQTLADGDASVNFSSYGAALFLCPVRLKLGDGALFACAGQRVGAVRVEGEGFDVPRERTGLLYDVGARLRLGLPLWGSLRFESAVGAEVPLSRFRYFATRQNGQQVGLFRQSAVIATAQAGVGLFFR